MKFTVTAITILSFLMSFLVFLISKSAIHEILATLFAIIASSGVFTLYIVETIKGKEQ